MELFFQYLKQRRPWIGVGILFAGIFGLVFYLYRLPLEAVLYPTVLCGVLGLGLLIRDFQRVRQKYRQLSGVRTMADAMVGLPPAEGLEEAAYQQIVRLLCQEQNDLRTATGKRYQDMVDYYTIWAHQIKTPIASMDLTLQGEDSPLSRKLSGELLRIGQYVQMVLMFLRLDGDTTDYVFREQALDTFTIEDNIYLPLVLAGRPHQEMAQRLKPIAQALGIRDLLKKYPYEVSGSQKQRAAVARAIITRPKLVLADEPSGSLDSKATDELLALFSQINRQGHTILMVTHSVKAASHAGRVLFIKDGQVFHQIYRGSSTNEQLYQKILDTLTMLATGGDRA